MSAAIFSLRISSRLLVVTGFNHFIVDVHDVGMVQKSYISGDPASRNMPAGCSGSGHCGACAGASTSVLR